VISRIRPRCRDTNVARLATRPKVRRKDHAVPAARVKGKVKLAILPHGLARAAGPLACLRRRSALTSGCSDQLRRNDLKPQHVRTYEMSWDPVVARKALDVGVCT
jgi:hypothetical protein